MRIVYCTPGVFDMGGISRYGRYQLRALREIVGAANVTSVSMLGREPGGFDELFEVDAVAGGNRLAQKVRFVMAVAARSVRHGVYWSGHLNYAPVVLPLARLSRGAAIVNIYGLEVWSNRSRLKEACLRRAWVIADCASTLQAALKMGIVDRSRSVVIHDPVDLSVFFPASPDAGVAERYRLALNGKFRVLFLGRLDKGSLHKGPDRLIRAFAKARLPQGAELVIAGSGNESENLRILAFECGVGNSVKLIGRVADKDLAPLYRMASVFVLVSQRYLGGGEGIPLAPLEAAACGVPIIVGNEDGSREACVPDESGMIVPSRDENALIGALERISRNSDLRKRLGDTAAIRIKNEFSFERFLLQHRQFVERISMEPSFQEP